MEETREKYWEYRAQLNRDIINTQLQAGLLGVVLFSIVIISMLVSLLFVSR